MRLSGGGSDCGYVRLDPYQKSAFDLWHNWVMQTPAVRERIAAETPVCTVRNLLLGQQGCPEPAHKKGKAQARDISQWQEEERRANELGSV